MKLLHNVCIFLILFTIFNELNAENTFSCKNFSSDGFPANSIEDQIRHKLMTKFSSEDAIRILWYLDQEAKAYKNEPEDSPAWKTLKVAFNYDDIFESYANEMITDTKSAQNNPKFLQTLDKMYSQMLAPSNDLVSATAQQGADLSVIASASAVSGFMGFSHAMRMLPKGIQVEILGYIPEFIKTNKVVAYAGKTSLANQIAGRNDIVSLATVQLSVEVVQSINLWWQGRITGVRCCKMIIDSTVTIGAGVGGSIGGAALGSFAGPYGTVFGGLAGGMACAGLANYVSDLLTQRIFGIPKDVALENAYVYFGVSLTATNVEVNSAYRSLSRKHHPDKGGKQADFILVQVHMAVIKAARESL